MPMMPLRFLLLLLPLLLLSFDAFFLFAADAFFDYFFQDFHYADDIAAIIFADFRH